MTEIIVMLHNSCVRIAMQKNPFSTVMEKNSLWNLDAVENNVLVWGIDAEEFIAESPFKRIYIYYGVFMQKIKNSSLGAEINEALYNLSACWAKLYYYIWSLSAEKSSKKIILDSSTRIFHAGYISCVQQVHLGVFREDNSCDNGILRLCLKY